MGADRGDLVKRLVEGLPPPGRSALDRTLAICRDRGVACYLVGGGVRDLLLRRRHLDLDIAVEAEVEPIAGDLAAASGGRLVSHRRFGTAMVSGPGFEVDLARTRKERYPRPGALPEVEPADLAADLARRDFGFNAIALRLVPEPGELIDPFGGLADLEARRVRVLHDASFRDDPTRMLRACRYAARLGFALEPATDAALRRDLGFVDAVSGPRLRRELTLLLDEEEAVAAARLATDLGLLAAVHPLLGLRRELEAPWRRALSGRRHAPAVELGLCLIAAVTSEAEVAALSQRVHLVGRLATVLRDFVCLQDVSATLARGDPEPSEVVEMLEWLAPAAIWARSLTETGAFAALCGRYLEEWRRLRPQLRGGDLLALGVPAGPAVGEALRALRRARLDGLVRDRDDEVALAREIARKGDGG